MYPSGFETLYVQNCRPKKEVAIMYTHFCFSIYNNLKISDHDSLLWYIYNHHFLKLNALHHKIYVFLEPFVFDTM